MTDSPSARRVLLRHALLWATQRGYDTLVLYVWRQLEAGLAVGDAVMSTSLSIIISFVLIDTKYNERRLDDRPWPPMARRRATCTGSTGS